MAPDESFGHAPIKSLSAPGLSYITSCNSPRFPVSPKEVPGVLTTTELVFVSFQILDRECGSMPKRHNKDRKTLLKGISKPLIKDLQDTVSH